MKHSFPTLSLLAAFSLLPLSQAPGNPFDEYLAEQDHRPGHQGLAIPRPQRRDELPKPPPERHEDVERGFLRSFDGSGNNVENPQWGSAGTEYLRLSSPAYADGAETPSGPDRPGARAVSNAVAAQSESVPNRRGASDYLWQWGQFLDHDIDETPTVDPAEPFDIPVPAGDPDFDPTGSGTQTIPLNRSFYNTVDGVRQQVNAITAYIDGSQVYGSSLEDANALRTLDGTGRLKTSEGNLLPQDDNSFFLAGDVRVNEQVALTSIHTLFMREHNHWAGVYAEENPDAPGEEIYQWARILVAAEIQAITYREFLPIFLGPKALKRYRGYRPEVNAGISNEFAAAAFRVGHTMLSSTLLRLDASGREIDAGHLPLAEAFFAPQEVVDHGIEPILRGLAAQPCQEIDNLIIDDVRNFLFGEPGQGGFDLASLNIQRGRDHGLPGYNDMRRDLKLRPLRNFRRITRDREVSAKLASVYSSPDEMDPWVGALAEPAERGAMVGETIRVVLADQFRRLRDGDRFWYEHYLDAKTRRLVEKQTLATIIRRNTNIEREIPNNVFLVKSQRPIRRR